MQTGMLIVCFAALIVAVVVSIRFSVNVGIVAYALAFLVGGFGLGLPANTIVGYFPVSLFFQLMVITLFYGFAVSNGTMQKIADNAVFLCRNRSALVPWVIFLVAFVLCAIGCPPPGIGAALVALSVAVQKRTGMKYYMAISFSTFGAMAGGFMPLGLFSTITKGLIINVGGAEPAAAAAMMSKISLFMVLFELACAIAVYIWGGGYRSVKLDFAKPEPFTKKQRQTLIIIAAVLVLLVVPAVLKPVIPFFKTFTSYVSIISLSFIGALLCSALKLADEREVIRKNIPWSLLFMIAGAVSLINVMNQAGLTEFLSGMFTEGMGTVVEALLFCLLAGCLSFFVDSTGVVLLLFIPVAFRVGAGGLLTALYIAALCAGAYAAGNCPLSTGGSLMMSQVEDAQRQKVFYQVWIGAFATLGIALILTLVGAILPW